MIARKNVSLKHIIIAVIVFFIGTACCLYFYKKYSSRNFGTDVVFTPYNKEGRCGSFSVSIERAVALNSFANDDAFEVKPKQGCVFMVVNFKYENKYSNIPQSVFAEPILVVKDTLDNRLFYKPFRIGSKHEIPLSSTMNPLTNESYVAFFEIPERLYGAYAFVPDILIKSAFMLPETIYRYADVKDLYYHATYGIIYTNPDWQKRK